MQICTYTVCKDKKAQGFGDFSEAQRGLDRVCCRVIACRGGRSVRVSYVHVLRFRDGRQISFHLVFDWLSMLQQLGLVRHPSLDEHIQQLLFHGDGLGQVSWLVYVAAAADGDVVSEELQRHYLQNHGQFFRRGRDI